MHDVAGNGNLASVSDNSVRGIQHNRKKKGRLKEGPILPTGGFEYGWHMVWREAIAYLAAGSRNPMGHAIRAAYLWQNGSAIVDAGCRCCVDAVFRGRRRKMFYP